MIFRLKIKSYMYYWRSEMQRSDNAESQTRAQMASGGVLTLQARDIPLLREKVV